jgi:hypothetical protein
MSILVGLGPQGIAAVGAPDQAFEEIFPFRSGMEGLRAARVFLQSELDSAEETFRNQRLMASWE